MAKGNPREPRVRVVPIVVSVARRAPDPRPLAAQLFECRFIGEKPRCNASIRHGAADHDHRAHNTTCDEGSALALVKKTHAQTTCSQDVQKFYRRSSRQELPGDDPRASAQVRLMRIKMLQRIGDRLEQLLGFRGIAALTFQTIDAKSKFSDAIFGLCNPLGYIDEIRRNAPHVVYPYL